MADTKTTLTVAGALVIGALGGVALNPVKEESLRDITVAEMVASKMDSTAQRVEASDAVREAGRVTVYDIKPAVVDSVGKMKVPAETLSVKEVDLPRAIVRPENTIRIPEVPTGATLRVVAFIDEKAIAEWATSVTEAPDAAKITRAAVQITMIDQVR